MSGKSARRYAPLSRPMGASDEPDPLVAKPPSKREREDRKWLIRMEHCPLSSAREGSPRTVSLTALVSSLPPCPHRSRQPQDRRETPGRCVPAFLVRMAGSWPARPETTLDVALSRHGIDNKNHH